MSLARCGEAIVRPCGGADQVRAGGSARRGGVCASDRHECAPPQPCAGRPKPRIMIAELPSGTAPGPGPGARKPCRTSNPVAELTAVKSGMATPPMVTLSKPSRERVLP